MVFSETGTELPKLKISFWVSLVEWIRQPNIIPQWVNTRMETAKYKQQRYQLSCQGLPLAVYREVAAHLRQVGKVQVGLFSPPDSELFDYNKSQVGGLWLEYAEDAEDTIRQKVDQILAYYEEIFGHWEENLDDS